jgi:hypothetical protein
MIQTVTEMYKAFLLGIKKEQSTIVPPSIFNELINIEQLNYIQEKVTSMEINQKRIDDLQKLIVITDGEYVYEGIVLKPIAPDTYHGRRFTLPYDPQLDINNDWVGVTPLPETQKYPRYFRLRGISFKVKYSEHGCFKGAISEFMESKILRGDSKTVIKKNPYRKPKETRLYHEIVNNKIILSAGEDDIKGLHMQIEYIRYPRVIFFNETNQAANINCELHPEAQKEIVDRAVLNHLERVKSQRFQTANYQEQKQNNYKQ